MKEAAVEPPIRRKRLWTDSDRATWRRFPFDGEVRIVCRSLSLHEVEAVFLHALIDDVLSLINDERIVVDIVFVVEEGRPPDSLLQAIFPRAPAPLGLFSCRLRDRTRLLESDYHGCFRRTDYGSGEHVPLEEVPPRHDICNSRRHGG